MPTDLLNIPPVIIENADTVRARFDADATAGLDPSDARYPDITVGGFYWDTTQPGVMEAVKQWDSMTEMIAAMFPGTAWGEYLDLHGETVNVPRKDEVEATGEVEFTGPVGTLIPDGTRVSTAVIDPSTGEDPHEFVTDESITLAPTPGPTNLLLTGHTSGGTLLAGVYYYRVSAVVGGEETVTSDEEYVILTTDLSSVDLAWTLAAGATDYNIYRGSLSGAEILLDSVAAPAVIYTDDGSAIPGTARPSTNSVGVTAVTPGSASSVPAGTISLVLSPIDGSPAVTNVRAMSGGADVESDDRYRVRILLAYSAPKGGGVVADYERWALSFPAIGFVSVEPLWSGAGTVRVIINDQSNQPVSAAVIAALQTFLDPIPGEGAGAAPIGAIVTVATTTIAVVTASAVITHKDGFSLDGAAGTTATRDALKESIKTYVNNLRPGEDVILNQVVAQLMLVPGVHDVGTVHLDGSAANVSITALQVANILDGAITLT